MCHDLDSRPPIPPLAGAAVDGARVELASADGNLFTAFRARPGTLSGAAMLILPDVRGLHPFYEELALRFAEAGIEALAIDYFGRTAPAPPRAADFEYHPHADQVRHAAVFDDIRAARDELAATAGVRAVFSVGFCFGGRLAFLTASHAELALTGSIGFYGPPQSQRNDIPPPTSAVRSGQAAVLGLFGGDDPSIPSAAVEGFRQSLDSAGVENELVTYPGAPHSFFDRKAADFADESADAWRRVLDFVRRNTPDQRGLNALQISE